LGFNFVSFEDGNLKIAPCFNFSLIEPPITFPAKQKFLILCVCPSRIYLWASQHLPFFHPRLLSVARSVYTPSSDNQFERSLGGAHLDLVGAAQRKRKTPKEQCFLKSDALATFFRP
jgi:hypothetical protein